LNQFIVIPLGGFLYRVYVHSVQETFTRFSAMLYVGWWHGRSHWRQSVAGSQWWL